MGNARVKTIIASLGLLGGVVSIVLFFRPSPPLGNPKTQEAVGQVLAEQAARLLVPGGQIVLIARDTSVFPNPATGFQLRAFHATLKQLGFKVGATNYAKLDPLRPVRVPPGDFYEILRRCKDGDVVVSLLGPPLLGGEERARLAGKKVRVAALCSGGMPRQVDLRAVFEQELLHAAVISRTDPRMAPPQTSDRTAWFRHYYLLITVANLTEMPLPAAALPR